MATMEAWQARPNRGWMNNRPKGMKTTADFFREARARDPYIPPAWMFPPQVEPPKQESLRYEGTVRYNDNVHNKENIRYEQNVRYEDSIQQEDSIFPEERVPEKRVTEQRESEEESGWDVNEDFTHPSEISMSTSPRVRIFTRAVPKRRMNFVELSEYFGKADNSKLLRANEFWPEEGEAADDDEEEDDEDEEDEDRNTLRKLSRLSVSPKVESTPELVNIVPERAAKVKISSKREAMSKLRQAQAERARSRSISKPTKVERTFEELASTAPETDPATPKSTKAENMIFENLVNTAPETVSTTSEPTKAGKKTFEDLTNIAPETIFIVSKPTKAEKKVFEDLANTAPERLEIKAEQDSTLDAFESALSTQEHHLTCCEKYYAHMTKLEQVKRGIRDVKEGLGRLIDPPNTPETTPNIAADEANRKGGRFTAYSIIKWIGIVCAVLCTLFLLECLLWGIYGRRTASKFDNWHPHDPFFGYCLSTKLNEWTFSITSTIWYAFRDLIDGHFDPYGTRFRPLHPKSARMGANDWWQGRSGPVGYVPRMDPGTTSDKLRY